MSRGRFVWFDVLSTTEVCIFRRFDGRSTLFTILFFNHIAFFFVFFFFKAILIDSFYCLYLLLCSYWMVILRVLNSSNRSLTIHLLFILLINLLHFLSFPFVSFLSILFFYFIYCRSSFGVGRRLESNI